MSFELTPDLRRRVAELESDLRSHADDTQAEWDSHTETWQESEIATDASAWIESLYDLADALEGLPEEA